MKQHRRMLNALTDQKLQCNATTLYYALAGIVYSKRTLL